MKIEQQNIAGAGSSQNIALNPANGQRTSAAVAAGGDQAELSGVSKAIQSFQSTRSARVAQLTALVQSGRYDVNPTLVSRGVINEALNSAAQPSGGVAR